MCCTSGPPPATAHMGRVPVLFSKGTRSTAQEEAEASTHDLRVRVPASRWRTTLSAWLLSQEESPAQPPSCSAPSRTYIPLCWLSPFPHHKTSFSRGLVSVSAAPRPGTEMVLSWYFGEQMSLANSSPRSSNPWLFFVLKSQLTWFILFSEPAERNMTNHPGSLTLPRASCPWPCVFLPVHTFPFPLRSFTRILQMGRVPWHLRLSEPQSPGAGWLAVLLEAFPKPTSFQRFVHSTPPRKQW